MKPNSNLNSFRQLLFYTIPTPLDQYNLFWSYKKLAPKLLLGRQNCVTLTGGRHTLVPGLLSFFPLTSSFINIINRSLVKDTPPPRPGSPKKNKRR